MVMRVWMLPPWPWIMPLRLGIDAERHDGESGESSPAARIASGSERAVGAQRAHTTTLHIV
eukprot:1679437-Prymnesium_polylepis.1